MVENIVVIYSGRFQPFHMGHYHAYEFLVKKFGKNNVYIGTSNKTGDRSPFNFNEKKKIIKSMFKNIPSKNIVQVTSPYRPKEITKKFNQNTTAAIFGLGKKDINRLGGKYFRKYDDKLDLLPLKKANYVIEVPQLPVKISGKVISGTIIRHILSNSKQKVKKNLFRKLYNNKYDEKIFNLVDKKIVKENFNQFLNTINLIKIIKEVTMGRTDGADVDDGPATWYKRFEHYEKGVIKKAEQYGWQIINYILTGGVENITKGPQIGVTYFPAGIVGKATSTNYKDLKGKAATKAWLKDIRKTALNLGFKFVSWKETLEDIEQAEKSSTEDFKNQKEIDKDNKGNINNLQQEGIASTTTTTTTNKLFSKNWWDTELYINNLTVMTENPDTTTNDKGVRIGYGQNQAYPFGWSVGGHCWVGLPKGNHMDEDSWNKKGFRGIKHTLPDKFVSRSSYKYPGRMWIKDKIISFWKYPENLKKLKQLITDLEKTRKVKIWNNGWKIEVPGQQKKTKETELIPVEYFGHKKDYYQAKWDKKTYEKQHILSPSEKDPDRKIWQKFIKNKPKNMSTAEYKWLKSKYRYTENINNNNNNKKSIIITEGDPDSLRLPSGERLKFDDSDAIAFMYIKGQIYVSDGRDNNSTHMDVIGNYAKMMNQSWLDLVCQFGSRSNNQYPGRMWTKRKIISLWEYPSPSGFKKLIKDLNKVKNIHIDNSWKVEVNKNKIKPKDWNPDWIITCDGTVIIPITDYFQGKKRKISDLQKQHILSPLLKTAKKVWMKKRKLSKGMSDAEYNAKRTRYKFTENIGSDIALLLEGGAFGHLNHPFDDNDLTFGDFKEMITQTLSGEIVNHGPVEFKTDGQNIMVSYINGKLVAARNKGHLKNFGKNALSKTELKAKFSGRGAIEDAFYFAIDDLERALSKVSDKELEKIFDNGKNFMSLEIIYPETVNVIPYDLSILVFHGILKYDEKGNPIGANRGFGNKLAKLIKNVNTHVQKKFTIKELTKVKLVKSENFDERKNYYINKVNKLKNKFNLKDSDEVFMYHQAWWTNFIKKEAKKVKYNIPEDILKKLVKRYAFFVKQPTIAKIKKEIDNENFIKVLVKLEKGDWTAKVKENMEPFEMLFLELGVEVMNNLDTFMTPNPDKAVQTIRKNIKKQIENVKNSGDITTIKKMETLLKKIKALGGFDKIVPSEGLTFHYKGKLYKYTGQFAPINQLIGLIRYAK